LARLCWAGALDEQARINERRLAFSSDQHNPDPRRNSFLSIMSDMRGISAGAGSSMILHHDISTLAGEKAVRFKQHTLALGISSGIITLQVPLRDLVRPLSDD
jgi:hypothetical protein